MNGDSLPPSEVRSSLISKRVLMPYPNPVEGPAICAIPECSETVSAVENGNGKLSKLYCEHHASIFTWECDTCGKALKGKASDYIRSVKKTGFKPLCRKCSLDIHNRSDAMVAQASQIGKEWGSKNIRKAIEKSFTPEAIAKREKSKRDNGFWDPGGPYKQGLQKRKESGALKRFNEAGLAEIHGPNESIYIGRGNVTKWNRKTDEEKAAWIALTHTPEALAAAEETKRKRGVSLADPAFRASIGCNGAVWKALEGSDREAFVEKLKAGRAAAARDILDIFEKDADDAGKAPTIAEALVEILPVADIPDEERILKKAIAADPRSTVKSIVGKLKRAKKWNPALESAIIEQAAVMGVPLNARDRFYASVLSFIAFKPMDSVACSAFSLDIAESFRGKPLVWSVETAEGVVLDVCITVDGEREMLQAARLFAKLVEDPSFVDVASSSSTGRKRKFLSMLEASNGNPIFRVIAEPANQEEASLIEMQYAHDNKAKFWNPDPFQKAIVFK